jgi:hypothetical protein
MSKIKLLLDVVTDMRNLAGSIQAVAEAMQKSEENIVKKNDITMEQIRTVLVEKSRNNFEEVRKLLEKYGASKLSAISPEKYPELMADAERLGNE